MKPLGAMITGLMTKTLKKRGNSGTAAALLALIVSDWNEIVGEALAARSKPVKLQRNLLVINAPAGAALELQHQSDSIIAAINKRYAFEVVGRLKFIQ